MFICFNLPFSLYEPGINIMLEVDKFQINNGKQMGIAEVFSLRPRIVKIIWQKKLKCILIIIIFIKLKFLACKVRSTQRTFGLINKMKLNMTIPCKKNSSKLCGSEFLFYDNRKWQSLLLLLRIYGQYHVT